ncbi:MAG: hypothetical protein ACOVNU_09205 [Candidatus Kapaibacteriota bacterium]
MKLEDKLFYGLLFVGVGLVIYNYKDKIFKGKEDKNNSSTSSEGNNTPPKLINTENLGLNTTLTPTNTNITSPIYDNPLRALNKVVGTDSAGNVIIEKSDGTRETLYNGLLQNKN